MLGVLPGIVGSLQAMEVIKLILGLGTPAIGKLVHYDAFTTSMRTFKLKSDPECKLCGTSPSILTPQLTEFKSDTPNCMKEITVQELNNKMQQSSLEFLLDVRMPQEFAAANLGGHLIPLPELEQSLGQIPKDTPITIHCKAGVRSARACFILMEHGYTDVTNVIGGTDAWREEIDPSFPPA